MSDRITKADINKTVKEIQELLAEYHELKKNGETKNEQTEKSKN